MKDDIFYRYVLINNQETCYVCVVKVLEGYFKCKEDVKKHYSEDYNFNENLFSVERLDFTGTPRWLLESIIKGG